MQPRLDAVYSHLVTSLGSTTKSEDLTHQLYAVLQRREAQLTRLDSHVEGIVQDLRNRQAELELEYAGKRRKLEEDAELKLTSERRKLDTETSDLRENMEREIAERTGKLSERLLAVEAREKAADDSDNRAARRKLREKMLQILSDRSEKFGLTPATRMKRIPVIVTASIAAIFFATILGLTVYSQYGNTDAVNPASIVTEITAALGFASALVFLLRFTQQWAKRHADEEFYLKRLELDLERASWLVEMSLEYAAERETPIPAEMFERLSRGLFGVETSPDVRHPLETLLGAASEAHIQLPNANLRVNRRGLQRLADESQTTDEKSGKQ